MISGDEPYPVIDLHCDLLSYLVEVRDSHPCSRTDIGCALPHLREGRVGLQVLAAFAATKAGSADCAERQSDAYESLLRGWPETLSRVSNPEEARASLHSDKIGILFGIENASGLSAEGEPLRKAFQRLERIIAKTGRVFYISLTHNDENRFGGGNNSSAGLKEDGRVFLEYLDGKRIAVDLSHTSDALAQGILNHVDKKRLDIPVLASHSNFRSIFDHPRNLPDEIAGELIRRNGLIGMNFLRAFVHPDNPDTLLQHIRYGLDLGAEKSLCFGADFFCTKSHPDRARMPFFFREHENAGTYPHILSALRNSMDPGQRKALAYENALTFIDGIWGEG
jgi:membrane dipeptidase